MRSRGEPIDPDTIVRWTVTNTRGRRVTHYGAVVAVHDNGMVDIEYTHSVPALNVPASRIVHLHADRVARA